LKKVVLNEILSGAKCKIYAYGTKSKCPVNNFFEKQKKERPEELAKLMALLTTTATQGTPTNIQKCRPLRDKIWEFKTPGGLRLLFFWDCGYLIIATHGFLKKKPKTPSKEINMASKLRNEYIDAKNQDSIEFKGSDSHD